MPIYAYKLVCVWSVPIGVVKYKSQKDVGLMDNIYIHQ